jgi:hypothetical protein
VIAVATLCGCATEPATQLVVVVDSDLHVPDELDELRVRVLDTDGELATDRTFRLGTGEGNFMLPTDFGVAPRDVHAPGLVTIEVSPMLLGRALFVTRAVTGFREGHQLRLDWMLPRSCVVAAAECAAAQTCGPEGCVDPAIDPSTLEEFEP